MAVGIDWGSVPDWIAGLGGLGSLSAAWWIARSERRARIAAEEATAELAWVHQCQIAGEAIKRIDEAIDLFGLLGTGSDSIFEASHQEAANIRDAGRRILVLRDWPMVVPQLSFLMEEACRACQIEKVMPNNPALLAHVLRQGINSLGKIRERLIKGWVNSG